MGICLSGGRVLRIILENGPFTPGVDCVDPSGSSSRLHGPNIGSLLVPEHEGVDHVLQDRHMRPNTQRRRKGRMLTLLTPSTRNPTSGAARARRRGVSYGSKQCGRTKNVLAACSMSTHIGTLPTAVMPSRICNIVWVWGGRFKTVPYALQDVQMRADDQGSKKVSATPFKNASSKTRTQPPRYGRS